MPAPDFYIKAGDTYSPINRTLLDANNAPMDISAATGVRFHMQPVHGGTFIDRAAQVVNAAQGTVRYAWQAGDTATPGMYLAEWEVTYAGGATETFPNGGYDVVLITAAVA